MHESDNHFIQFTPFVPQEFFVRCLLQAIYKKHIMIHPLSV